MIEYQDKESWQALYYNLLAKAFGGSAVVSGVGNECEVNINTGTVGGQDTLVVNDGTVLIDGSRVSVAQDTVTIAEADDTFPRKDVVYIDSNGDIQVAQGQPEQRDPSDATRIDTERPAPPDLAGLTAVPLAEVYVSANAEQLIKDDVIDVRVTGLSSGFIEDFEEAVEDVVGGLAAAEGNISVSYDDAGNTLTIDTSALNDEEVRDEIGSTLSAGTGIDITVDDAGDTITVAAVREQVEDWIAQTLVAGDNLTVTHNDSADEVQLDTDALDEEEVEDAVAALLVGGDKVTVSYDDANDALTVNTSALDQEEVQDAVNGLIQTSGLVAKTYDDGTGTLTIGVDPADISHDDIDQSTVSDDDHHARYTDSEASAAAPVQSVFGRVGAVAAQAGDYAASQISNFASAARDAINESDITPSSVSTPEISPEETDGKPQSVHAATARGFVVALSPGAGVSVKDPETTAQMRGRHKLLLTGWSPTHRAAWFTSHTSLPMARSLSLRTLLRRPTTTPPQCPCKVSVAGKRRQPRARR
ncbi:hypothetical protein ACFQL1_01565 [Halomicroarcula sp. GCM10025709]|uniref:hypothetical protein n=1 Tax=Halomicroarcula sp. GCM10025709 TaxID=3252669 RepID=UPI0036090D90